VVLVLAACATAPAPWLVYQPTIAPWEGTLVAKNDPGVLQTAALFERGCFPFIGDAAGLRAGARAQHVQLIPASSVLPGDLGIAYNFSTPAAQRLLVSFDNGKCAVSTITPNSQEIMKLINLDMFENGRVEFGYKTLTKAKDARVIQSFGVRFQGGASVVTYLDWLAPQLAPPAHAFLIGGEKYQH
jgi:hypothetical protein